MKIYQRLSQASAVVALLLASCGCEKQSALSKPAATIDDYELVETNRFSGSDYGQTTSFTVDADEWVVKWAGVAGKQSDRDGSFAISIVGTGGTTHRDIVCLGQTAPASGHVVIHKRGTFYFDVSAINTDWEISVEEVRLKD